MERERRMKRLGFVAVLILLALIVETRLEAGPFARRQVYGRTPFRPFSCRGVDVSASPFSVGMPFDEWDGEDVFGNSTMGNRWGQIGDSYWVGEKVSLFNGVDLTGWTNSKGETPPDGWGVADGVIYKKGGQTGNLFTAKEYESFILEFEFKIEDKTNSGVKYRTWVNDDWGMGCEYQVFDNEGGTDNGPLHFTGALYDVYEPVGAEGILKKGEFNQAKIVVMGNYIEHWLNGVRTVSAVVDSADWRERVAKSKFSDCPEFGHVPRSRLFLQDHDTPVWFRNFTITELTPVGMDSNEWGDGRDHFLCEE